MHHPLSCPPLPNGLGQRKAPAVDLMVGNEEMKTPSFSHHCSFPASPVSLKAQLLFWRPPTTPGPPYSGYTALLAHSGPMMIILSYCFQSLGILPFLVGFLNLDHATVNNPFFKLVSVKCFLNMSSPFLSEHWWISHHIQLWRRALNIGVLQ